MAAPSRTKPARMMLLALRRPALRPGEHGDAEHREGQGCERDARLERVVAPDQLEVDRQDDQEPAQRDLLEQDLGDAVAEQLGREQGWIEQRGLALALASDEPVHQAHHRSRADREEQRDGLAALLPREDPDDEAAHADHREERPRNVDRPVSGVGHVTDAAAPQKDDCDDERLDHEPDAPRQERRDQASDQGTDRSGNRSRRTDQREHLRAGLPLEVAVDQRLHRREVKRGAQPAEDRPEDDDRREALREHHGQRPDGVEHHADDECALAPEQVTDLAADEDERSGHERLDGHGRLDPAHRRVEVVDDRRDRDVHERRVDHEHEHRGGQKDALARNTARALSRTHALHSRERTAPG